jgi:hypothetical protein
VFSIRTDGGGFRTLQSFPVAGAPAAYGGGAGVRSVSPLVFSPNGKVLYGTAVLIPGGPVPLVAGITAGGTVFGLTTSGSPIENLWTCGSWFSPGGTNLDGAIPDGVMRLGKALYGTMTIGGLGNGGLVFRLGLGLGATVSATPTRAQLGGTITVKVTVLNRDEENVSNVRLAGPITVYSNGVVAAAGFSGPTMTPVLAPLTKTTFTYLYTATNYGTVNFTAAATGVGLDGVVTSSSWTSDSVTIAPQGDLMVKSADPKDTQFRGAGEYQQVASGDQIVTQPVGTNGKADYIVRLQNDDTVAQSCVLQGITNNVANWAVKVLAGNVNISDALISATGWATPLLAPTGHLDLQVSLAPLPKAGMNDNKSILIKAWDNTGTLILDAVSLHAKLVPIPVKVTINAISAPDAALSGYMSESLSRGMTDINAPLVPNVDPAVLDPALAQMAGGLVADGVTPLVIKLETDPASFSQFPNGLDFVFEADILGGGSLKGDPMAKRLALLQNGAWPSATDVVLSASSPIAYVQFLPILSDDLAFTDVPPELLVDFIVKDNSANFAGDAQFKLRKPPIALIHGYASSGDWGADFKAILGNSRPYLGEGNPGNFVITVKYGQDEVPGLANSVGKHTPLGPVYVNTIATLKQCAQMVERELRFAIGPLHATWAFTRFDVVCHSQGGLLARMLCSASPANSTISAPYRNADNCNRGRFHRAVTIGSPHNGSRILHYLLALERYQKSFRGQMDATGIQQLVAEGMILSKMAQEKFDPFGDQILEINGNILDDDWVPDPDARFHLVRAVIDNGFCPTFPDATIEYQLLALANSAGGSAVIPRGSDGVVDLDSMGGNVPPAAVAHNVFTVQAANNISHAGPLWVFGADSFEVASTVVAQHVIGALDQLSSMNPNDIVFDSFPMPPLLNVSQETLIDDYASSSAFWQTAKDALSQLPHALDTDTSYQYQVLFPSNLPPVSDVTWYVRVYNAAGIASDGVVLTPWGTNNSYVTVTVDNALVGDVVLSAFYLSVSNTVVMIPSALVVSLAPSGGTLTGIQLLPANIALPVGTTVSPQLMATYSDGSSSLRYAAPGTVMAVSSQPSVVSVDDPLNWQLSAVGTAQINVTWSGFAAHSQITVFDSASSTPPTLSLQPTGNGQLSAAWVGFETAYVLETSGDLQQTNSWQPVATAPLSGGGWTTVPLAMTNTQQFFRLRWDPSAINF